MLVVLGCNKLLSFATERVLILTGRLERLHIQGCILAHGMTTKTFCDDVVKQLKRFIPVHTGAQGTIQFKVCHLSRESLGKSFPVR